MKIKALLAVATAAVLVSGAAVAEHKKYYVGYEQTDWELVAQNAVARGDVSTEGQQINAGYQASENFSVELVYGENDDADASYYGVLLRPQTELFSIVNASIILGKFGGDFFDDVDDFSWGFGFEVAPSEAFSLTADWIHYAEDDDGTTGIRVTGVNIGARFRFGGEDD